MQQHFSRKRYTISKLQLTLLLEAKWKLCRFVTAPNKTATSLYHIDWNKANFFQMVSVNRPEAFYLTRYLPTVIAYLSDLRFDFTNQFGKTNTQMRKEFIAVPHNTWPVVNDFEIFRTFRVRLIFWVVKFCQWKKHNFSLQKTFLMHEVKFSISTCFERS